ncbi:MAG: ribose-phosphate pyrophosphokinase [Proteobacteria bacterium]|nr:ribose-phosphate pyrophosphokinase [Pseudomonadota bacterium]
MRGQLSIIAGRSNPRLATSIAQSIGVEPTNCDVRRYSDGELSVEIGDNVRGQDVFVIQSTSSPGNDHLMELLMIIDALKRASAERITAVLPYFGYARQDRKPKPRVPITAKLVSDLIVKAGADRVLTMDLHADQIMGFFDIPVDNLYSRPVLIKYLRENYSDKRICIVSPDSGGTSRARSYAKILDAGLAIIDKRRNQPNEVAEMKVVGDVEGQLCVVVDDMVDTGGTLIKAAEALIANGAIEVISCCTHPVLSGQAKERLPQSKVSKVIVNDTIYHADIKKTEGWLVSISVAPIIGEAIRRIHTDESVSFLFEGDN